jgi:type VI secretion system secreted protein VgrG
VLNDQSIQVDNQRTVLVGGLSSHELKGEEHHLTHGARKTRIGADDSLTVVGSRHIGATNYLVNAAAQVHLDSSTGHVVINAGLSATIKAGPHWINISPLGIFSSVPILLGGVPVPGMPGLPLALVPMMALAGGPSLVPYQQTRTIESGGPFCLRCAEAKKGTV